MNSSRLEAFSDGVLAIIITIMVLELKVPEGGHIETLRPLIPKFISYIISFVYVGLYWNNHHHLFHAIKKINGRILWANLFLLFSLSLLPFSSGWMGENHFAALPTALYGVVLLMAALAYWILQRVIIAKAGHESLLARATGRDIKGNLSLILYAAGIIGAFYYPWLAGASYVLVALMWLVPDRRIEQVLLAEQNNRA